MNTLPLILGTLLSLSATQAPPADKVAPGVPSRVKFEILPTRHMAVNIKVNGQGPFRVIFDTGAPISLLNGKVAKAAKLGKGKEAFPLLFGMQGQVTVKELEVGSLKAENVSVIVMDHPTVKAISEALGPIEGIIGFPFFAKFRTELDYQTKTMTFVPVDYDPGDLLQSLAESMMKSKKVAPKRVLASRGVWGLVVGKEESDTEAGVDVSEVLPGGAAAAAGVKVGDRLLVLDGAWTDSVEDCFRAAGNVTPGQSATAKIKRGDKTMTITIKPVAGL